MRSTLISSFFLVMEGKGMDKLMASELDRCCRGTCYDMTQVAWLISEFRGVAYCRHQPWTNSIMNYPEVERY